MGLESGMIDPRRIEVIDDATVAVLRAMTPAAKVAVLNRMVVEARELIRCALRSANPDWTDERLRAEVLRRFTARDSGDKG